MDCEVKVVKYCQSKAQHQNQGHQNDITMTSQ